MSSDNIIDTIRQILGEHKEICLGILYGSAIADSLTPESDIDLAVAGKNPLTANRKYTLIAELSSKIGRPIDLIDLQVTNGTLLHQILTTGKKIYSTGNTLHAGIIKRMLFNQTDMMPYYYRILNERRKRWIKES